MTTNSPTITETNKSLVNGKNREKPKSTQKHSSHPIQDLGSRTEKPKKKKTKRNKTKKKIKKLHCVYTKSVVIDFLAIARSAADTP